MLRSSSSTTGGQIQTQDLSFESMGVNEEKQLRMIKDKIKDNFSPALLKNLCDGVKTRLLNSLVKENNKLQNEIIELMKKKRIFESQDRVLKSYQSKMKTFEENIRK